MDIHLGDEDNTRQFEEMVLPHLDAAYNLARWLARNDEDAEDLVQTAFMRAFKFFNGFHGGSVRAWLLTIVRHTYYTSLRDNRHERDDVHFDEEIHGPDEAGCDTSPYGIGNDPETILAGADTKRAVNQALEKLPAKFREIVILKEIENLSYKEIAEIAEVPIGTVMSRLARGRKLLLDYLTQNSTGSK
jgi:RNA polymerase sigma factor (sigma-70 family)